MHPQPGSAKITESEMGHKILRPTPSDQLMPAGLHLLKVKQPSRTLPQIADKEYKHMSPWRILDFHTKTLGKWKI